MAARRGHASGDPPDHPDPAVLESLRAAGLQEVAIQNHPAMWILPDSSAAVDWRDALVWVGKSHGALAKKVASAAPSSVKPFHTTSEFWIAVTGVLGTASTGIAALADSGLAPSHPVIAGAAAVAGALVAIGYKFARARAKTLAQLEGGSNAHRKDQKQGHEEDSGSTR